MTTENKPTPEDMGDPLWRICHIYTIRSEEGKPVSFKPNEEQMEVLREIYEYGSSIIVIVKARQLGMSTLLAIICLDCILFGTSIETGLIDYNSNNAKKKLREKVFYAFDRLHPALKACYKVYSRSIQKGEFSIGPVWGAASTDKTDEQPYSTFYAGETPRGGTFQFLWFSEWWETAARFPQRSEDILTAGWPAGEQGVRVIETTVHGGKRGEAWNITKQGLGHNGVPLARELRTSKTPVVVFFPWWKKAKYREQGSLELVRPEIHRYFDELSVKLDVEFDHEQMLWYQSQFDTFGVFVKGQYPSTIHECWEAPVEGAILAEALDKCKKDGRVAELPYNASYEVDTFWDLGAPENTRTGYVQHINGQHIIIDHDGEMKLTLPDRIKHLKAKGYLYGTHYIPHDAGQRMKNGISYFQEFENELLRQGVPGRVIQLKVTPNKWLGINHLNHMLRTNICINSELTPLIDDMDLYRRKEDKTAPEKFTDEIAKGHWEHSVDSIRYLAESDLAGFLPSSSNGIMTNLYFDAPYIRELTQSMPEHRCGTWAIEFQGNKDFGRITARRDDTGGWLRIWEDPVPGRSYIVSLTLGAITVWRASMWDATSGKELPATLAAACVDEQGIHTSNLYKWASMASTHYGDAPITVDITSLPGAVEAMRLIGASVMARRQSASDRRVGQQSQEQRKPGHDFGPPERLEAYSILQALMRDKQAAIYCPVTLRQMQSIIIGDSGLPDLTDGAKEHWVKASALAVWNIGQAGIMRRPQTSSAPIDYVGRSQGGGGTGRRKLA